MLVAKASQYAEANCGATQGGLLKGMASSRSRSFCWIQAIQETSMVMPKDAGPFPVKMVNTEMYLPLSDVQEWWICASVTPWFLRPFVKGQEIGSCKEIHLRFG